MVVATFLGLLVGIILALTGAGGGVLAVPLLVFALQMSVAQAGPIGLLAVGMAATLGAILGLRKGIVRYKAALLTAGVGMFMSPLGLLLAHRIDNRWLSGLFALVLLRVAFRAYRRSKSDSAPQTPLAKDPPCVCDPRTGRLIWTSRCARALAVTGAIAGFLSGLLGVGGGFVIVPALQRSTQLSMQSIVATSLAVIALVSLGGLATSAAVGGVIWSVALPFSAGALAGMMGGRAVAVRLAGQHLQLGFAAVSAMVALGMLEKSLFVH